MPAEHRAELCVGDEIALQTLPTVMDDHPQGQDAPKKMVGFVAAREDALRCEYVEIGQAPSRKRHCRFMVTTPHQFSAAKRLERFLADEARSAASRAGSTKQNDWARREDRALQKAMEQVGHPADDDAHSDDMWQDIAAHIKIQRKGIDCRARWEHWKRLNRINELRAGKQREERHNRMDYDMRKGEPIVFGKIYQLLSVRFDKFLRADAAVADEDDRALGCSLADRSDRSRMCWFRFAPGFATRHEGDVVRAGDTVIVESVDNDGMFVHCAGDANESEKDDEAVDYGTFENLREVNASQSPTRLTVVQVASHVDCADPNLVRGGSFVQVYQRHSNQYLCCDQMGTIPQMHKATHWSSTRANLTWQLDKPSIDLSGANSVTDPTMVFNLKFAMTGDILCETDSNKCSLEKHDEIVAHKPCAQWQVVPFDATEALEYHKTSFRLQNVETKRYLVQDGDGGDLCTKTLQDLDNIIERHLLVFKSVPASWLQEFLDVVDAMSRIRDFKHAIDMASNMREQHGPVAKAADNMGMTRETLHLAEFKRTKLWANQLNDVAGDSETIKIVDNKDDLQKAMKKYVHPGAVADVISTHLRQAGRGRPGDSCAGPVLVTLRKFLWTIIKTANCNAVPENLSASELLERDGLINQQLQEMLSDFGCANTLIDLLDSIFQAVPAHATDESPAIETEQFERAHGPELLQTVRYCFKMLQMMSRGSRRNTRNFVDDIESLLHGHSDRASKTPAQRVLCLYLHPKVKSDQGFYCTLWNYKHQVSFKAADVILEMLRVEVSNTEESIAEDDSVSAASRLTIDQNLVMLVWQKVVTQRHPLYVELISTLLVRVLHDVDHSLKINRQPIKENQDLVIAALRPGWEQHKVDDFNPLLEEREPTCEHEFHVSLVKMAALLCMGRHRESISFFTEPAVTEPLVLDAQPTAGFGFSYDNVLTVIRSDFHDSARHAYAQLMLHLFVDRDPFDVYVPIQRTRIAATIRESNHSVDPRTNPVQKFADLKDAIRLCLEEGDGSRGVSATAVKVDGIGNRYESEDGLKVLFADCGLDPFMKATVRIKIDEKTGENRSYAIIELRDEEALGLTVQELKQKKHQLTLHRYNPKKAKESTGGMRQIRDIGGSGLSMDAAQIDHNRFCTALVNLARQLVLCGAYSETASAVSRQDGVLELSVEGRELGQMLLMVLDGSSDKVSSAAIQNACAQGIPSGSARYIMNEQNSIVMENKLAVIGVLKLLCQIRVSTQISTLVEFCTTPPKPQAGQTNNPLHSVTANIDTVFEREGRSPDEQQPKTLWFMAKGLEQVAKVRVFDAAIDDFVEKVLLDILQYEMADLVFDSLDVLSFFQAQAVVFYQSLQQVILVDTVAKANIVQVAHDQISTLTRLASGLHRETDCTECIQTIRALREHCRTEPLMCSLLRNFNLTDIVCRILGMRLGTSHFPKVVKATLLLIGDFCRGNPENQMLMASQMHSLVFPLLADPQYSEECCVCVCAILDDNTHTSLTLGDTLIHIVALQSRGDSRHPGFLRILQELLVVDSRIDADMQTKVCTAMTNPRNSLWQPDGGKVSAKEWGGSGPKVARVKMIEILLLGRIPEDSTDYYKRFKHTNKKLRCENGDGKDIAEDTMRRCSREAAYYATSLEVLGDCAVGDNQQVELLCSHRLSFVKVIKRLHELFNHPQCCFEHTKTRLDKTRIKNATMNFFREVFVTTGKLQLKSLRTPENGIWIVSIEESSIENCKPLGVSLLDDLKLLLPSSELWDSKATEEDRTNTRRYVVTQVAQFFTDFANAVPLHIFTPNEKQVITQVYMDVQQVIEDALAGKSLSWDKSEMAIMQRLQGVVESFIAGGTIARAASGSGDQTREEQANPVDQEAPAEWTEATVAVAELMRLCPEPKAGVDSNSRRSIDERDHGAFESTIGALRFGSVRELGIGIMRVAEALWTEVPAHTLALDEQHARGKHYSGFLASSLATKLENTDEFGSRDIEMVSSLLDAVRALLYVVCVYSGDQLTRAFRDFLNFEPLMADNNPHLARAQLVLMNEGWGFLCFRVLSQKRFSALHLAAMKLLRALLEGSNSEVKDILVKQLDDPFRCPTELCVSTIRRILQANITARSSIRMRTKPSVAARVHTDSMQGDTSPFDSPPVKNPSRHNSNNEDLRTEVFALEALRCALGMANGHRGMKIYLQQQPGHEDQLSIISDIVDHITDLEIDLMDAMDASSDSQLSQSSPRQQQAELAFQQAKAGLDILIALSTGPLPENQLAIAVSNVLNCLSRLLQRCVIVNRVVSSHGVFTTSFSPRAELDKKKKLGTFHLLRQISHLLVTLLEGTPQKQVIVHIVSALSWGAIGRHLRDLKDLMGSEKSENSRSERILEMVKRESFKLMTVLQKCTPGYNGGGVKSQMESASLTQLLRNPVVQFFRDRHGVVEVVREGRLEKLYFRVPDELLDEDVKERIETKIVQAMNAMPRDDTTSKLRAFVANAYELVAMEDTMVRTKKDPLMVWWNRIDNILPGNDAFFLSCLTTGVCLVSYDHTAEDRGSHDISTFGRVGHQHVEIVYNIFLAVGVLHVGICCLAFSFFVSVRVPVLRDMQTRNSRLNFFANWNGDETGRQQFKERSFQIYGIPDSFIEWNDKRKEEVSVGEMERKINMAFQQTLGLPAAASVKFKYLPGTANSWALISFAAEDHAVADDQLKSKVGTKKVGSSLQQVVELQGRSKNQAELFVGIRFLDSAPDGEMRQLDAVLAEAWIDVCSQDASLGHRFTAKVLDTVQKWLNKLLPAGIGQKIPIADAFYLRNSSEFWAGIADIVFSVLGFSYSPLAFSFHLTHLARLESAAIVMQSITANWRRLGNTLVLALMFMYMFAISGLLVFHSYHVTGEEETEGISQNPDGACASLLTCFTSYVYAGLLQTGIGKFLGDPTFPEHSMDLFTRNFGRLTWETLFMLVTSTMLMSVITGIICDTFSELRAQADEAQAYRSSTCFVTGIPYSRVPEEPGTRYMDYVALFLHLRSAKRSAKGKTRSRLQPLEDMIADHMDRGSVSWLPNGRCLSLERREQEETLENEVRHLREDMRSIQVAMSELSASVGAVARGNMAIAM